MPFIAHKEEIKKNIDLVEPALVIMSRRRESEFEDWAGNLSHLFPWVWIGCSKKVLREVPMRGVPSDEVQEDQPACLYYSSGYDQ